MGRITAVFQPQYSSSQNLEGYPAGDPQEIDVTWRVLQLPLEKLVDLSDDDVVAARLVENLHDHNGPFSVQVKESIAGFFGVENLQEITQALLDEKKPLVNRPPLSNTEYCAAGDICPICGSDDIDSHVHDIGAPSCSSSCNECDAEWTDDFQLRGYVPADGSGEYIEDNRLNSIVALFQPQYKSSENQLVCPAGDPQEIDVTWRVLHMPIKKLRGIQDDSEDARNLVNKLHNHNGPFSVEVKQSIADFFRVKDLNDVTQTMRNNLRSSVKKPPMTDYEYIAEEGSVCPYCGSNSIEEGESEYMDKEASRPMSCDDCESEWIELYHVIGYDVRVTGRQAGFDDNDEI